MLGGALLKNLNILLKLTFYTALDNKHSKIINQSNLFLPKSTYIENKFDISGQKKGDDGKTMYVNTCP